MSRYLRFLLSALALVAVPGVYAWQPNAQDRAQAACAAEAKKAFAGCDDKCNKVPDDRMPNCRDRCNYLLSDRTDKCLGQEDKCSLKVKHQFVACDKSCKGTASQRDDCYQRCSERRDDGLDRCDARRSRR